MKTLPTILVLGAGALALGFVGPTQDTEPAAAVASEPLPYSEARPATFVIRYDPTKIHLTYMLVEALIRPVSSTEATDPVPSLGLLFAPDNESQPPGVFVGRLHLLPGAPGDLKTRRQLIHTGLAHLRFALDERLGRPRRDEAQGSMQRLSELLKDARRDFYEVAENLADERAAQAASASASAEREKLAQDSEMLKLELPVAERQREEGLEELRLCEQALSAANTQADHARVSAESKALAYEMGNLSHSDLQNARRFQAQADAAIEGYRANVESAVANVEFCEQQRASINERLSAITLQIESIDKDIAAHGPGGPAASSPARRIELEVKQRVLEARVARLQESIDRTEEAIIGFTPVSVERW